MDKFRKPLFIAAGFLALILGAIGAVLPLLPTTPFVILAAFFFSKGSHKIHRWLLKQKIFGSMLQSWETDRVIPIKAKLLSTTMMLTMVSYPLLFRPFSLWLKVLVIFIVFYALWYVWKHRSEPVDTMIEQSWKKLSGKTAMPDTHPRQTIIKQKNSYSADTQSLFG
ncbi:YbaN family protein [Oceanospirillum sp.]|uniref:YbaN family protein n=1 Tax=Oceanospirillum sp. TaxID=2021254 RepID=UPI003A913A8E